MFFPRKLFLQASAGIQMVDIPTQLVEVVTTSAIMPGNVLALIRIVFIQNKCVVYVVVVDLVIKSNLLDCTQQF